MFITKNYSGEEDRAGMFPNEASYPAKLAKLRLKVGLLAAMVHLDNKAEISQDFGPLRELDVAYSHNFTFQDGSQRTVMTKLLYARNDVHL